MLKISRILGLVILRIWWLMHAFMLLSLCVKHKLAWVFFQVVPVCCELQSSHGCQTAIFHMKHLHLKFLFIQLKQADPRKDRWFYWSLHLYLWCSFWNWKYFICQFIAFPVIFSLDMPYLCFDSDVPTGPFDLFLYINKIILSHLICKLIQQRYYVD